MKLRKTKSVLIVFIPLLVGCNQSKPIDVVLSSNKCIWYIHDSLASKNGRVSKAYKFDSNGDCHYFLINRNSNALIEYNDDDVVVSQKWKLKDDTIFMRNIFNLILSYSNDSIYLMNPINKQIDTLVKHCN